MKTILIGLCASFVLLSDQASAATLVLFEPTGIPVPVGGHVDFYHFPISLLRPANPMVALSIDYESFAPPGGHDIVSGTLLFSPTQVASITPGLVTLTDYEALAQFFVGITAVSDESAPAFWAVHRDLIGPATTTLIWTATYLDGSHQSAIDGIIPESSSSFMLLSSVALLCCVRRRSKKAEVESGPRV
jgi:hypothetical protein